MNTQITQNCQETQQPDSKILKKAYIQYKIAKWCVAATTALAITVSGIAIGIDDKTPDKKAETIKAVVLSDATIESDGTSDGNVAVPEVVSEPVKVVEQPQRMIVVQPKAPEPVSSDAQEPTSDGYQTSYLGRFKISAYCHCSYCCGKSDGITATGTMVQANRTIAVDPRVIPLGSKVIIDGQTYVAEDTGGAIKSNRIDMYFATHQEALNFGIQYKDVSLVIG